MPNAEPGARPTAAGEYQKVVGALATRARRMGSRDPEAAAQEAIRRSLAHASSRTAVEYYFRDPLPANAEPPAWTLAQLLGWLHGVLRFVVWEDGARASSRRETSASIDELIEFPDRAPSQLDVVIDAELRAIVHECLTRLSDERRTALLLRLQGMKYQEIARRLDMNEKTVATWLHRGTLELIQRVRERMDGRPGVAASSSREVVKVSHA